ncbi:MAG: hypothetical protein AABW49_02090 [Nanoarchaeota archaeon]
MEKRGQATVFVAVGIVIVVVVALILYGRQTIFLPGTPDSLSKVLDDVNEHIVDCIGEVSEKPIIQIGLQGGYLNPGVDTFRLHNDTRISYLCYNMENSESCRNRLLLVQSMEEELNAALQPQIISCVGNIKDFGKLRPITIEVPEQFKVATNILQDNVVVAVEYPVIIKSDKTTNQVQRKTFEKIFEIPLGDLYLVVQDVLEQEITFGDFDPLLYMLSKKGEYTIIKTRPYPDKLYAISRNDNDYQLQFFIQGQPG